MDKTTLLLKYSGINLHRIFSHIQYSILQTVRLSLMAVLNLEEASYHLQQ